VKRVARQQVYKRGSWHVHARMCTIHMTHTCKARTLYEQRTANPSCAAFLKAPGRVILAPLKPRSVRANTSNTGPVMLASSLPPHCTPGSSAEIKGHVGMRIEDTSNRTASYLACNALQSSAPVQSSGMQCAPSSGMQHAPACT